MTESSDEKLLESLLAIQEKQRLEFSVHIENKSFALNEAVIEKSSTPVSSPTLRGGVYFSDTYVYKIKGSTQDSTIIPLLSKTMLGPNTEFGEILVKSSAKIDSNSVDISLYTNLTNSMQSSSKIELNLIIVRAEKKYI
ncbi:MAG: hypothetical protein ACE5EJ_00670 [Nitrosopumilaceae archaeon]